MAEIQQGNRIVTQITTVKLPPDRQDEVLNLMTERARFMSTQPGFVSIALHRSKDGSHIVNYIQWHDADTLEARSLGVVAMVADEHALDVVGVVDHPHVFAPARRMEAVDVTVTGEQLRQQRDQVVLRADVELWLGEWWQTQRVRGGRHGAHCRTVHALALAQCADGVQRQRVGLRSGH